MAITINQSPTTPNVTYTNLLYAVSSDQTNNAQYQYVMDVVSGSILTRIKQYPNPAGAGIFDVSRILNDYLSYDTSFSNTTTTGVHPQVQDFTINFGEEYAASLSGSVVLYNGNDITGSPAVNDGPIQVFPGVVDPNNGTSYNWLDSGSAVILSDRPSGIPVVANTDVIYQTFYNGTGGSEDVTIQALNSSGTVTDTATETVSPGDFLTINVGGTNAIAGFTKNVGLQITFDGNTITYPSGENCNWDRVNFVFINDYGFWDSYGVNLPVAKRTSIKREEITTPFADYSSATSQYSLQSRGKSYYNSSYEDRYSIYTDWLNQTEANWVTQMIESPEVFVQTNAGMVPIVITNMSYEHNTNKASQKTFQYKIEYQYSNNRPSRG